MKSWKAKLLGFDTAEESTKPKRRPARRRDDDEPEGLDYDEEFADDEEIILGIEDKDEAKEASMRLYGRAGKASFDSDGDSDLESGGVSTKVGKKIAKTLRKIEKNDAYDFDEENPYLSEVLLHDCWFTLHGSHNNARCRRRKMMMMNICKTLRHLQLTPSMLSLEKTRARK